MPTINKYYSTVFARPNKIKEFFVDLFLSLASWPRLLLEVWVRKNFGERYFSSINVVFLAIFLSFIPFVQSKFSSYIGGGGDHTYYSSFWQLVVGHPFYYLFILGFLSMSFLRRQEIRRLPSVFDFARFSLYNGDIHPRLRRLSILGQRIDIRTIETLIEPAFFLVVGFVLSYIDSLLGSLIIRSAILYSMSYFAAYHKGDHYMMDLIDGIISSEETVATIVEGKNPSDTRGFTITGRRPSRAEDRRKAAGAMLGEDEYSEVI